MSRKKQEMNTPGEYPTEPKKRPFYKKKRFLIPVGFIVLLILLSQCGGGDKTESGKVGEVSQTSKATETQSASEEEAAETPAAEESSEEPAAEAVQESPAEEAPEEEQPTEFHVGDIIQDGDVQITYMSSGVYQEENEFMQPEEGMQYIFIRLYCENLGDSDESVSMYSFECYADGYSAEQYYGVEEELSATLSAGRACTGMVAFTVPVDAQDIEIEYETNVWTEEKLTFLYEGEQDSGFVPPVDTTATEGAVQVGETIEARGLTITYLSGGVYTEENSFMQPEDGKQYVYIELEVENTSDTDQSISYFSFDCFADGAACSGYYGLDDELSAELSAGRKAQGCVAFEVPIDAQTIEVEYESNVWTDNRIVFAIP